MLLRYLVGQYVRQAAQEKMKETLQQAAEGVRARVAAEAQSAPRDENEPPPAPPPPADVAFLFAMNVEAGGLSDLLKERQTMRCATFVQHRGSLNEQHDVVVVETGVGREAARQAAEDALVLLQPRWVVSAGFAGALQESLRKGHIVMANEVCGVDGQTLKVGLNVDETALRATKGLHVGRLLTVDEIIATPDEKRRMGEEHDALACDMETMAIAQTCQERKVRFMAVRIITDAVDDRLPPEIDGLMNQTTWASKIGAAAGAIWNRPSSVKDMWALKKEALRATDRLAKFLASMSAQLT